MRSLKILPAILVLGAMPVDAAAQQPATVSEVVEKIVRQEQAEVQLLRQYSPLVETYIQNIRPDKQLGAVPNGDKYFLGRAELAKGVELEPLDHDASVKHKILGGWASFFSTEFVPRGFLQMIYLDMNGFDRAHYKIEYVRREFLGEVRCLVFDVDPLPRSGRGRFVGRIWVEDQDFHIVRFNGAYGGSSLTSNYFNFDSWRTNAGKNQWLPAYIYSEQGSVRDPKTRYLGFKAFRAQTRLWGYNLGNIREEQELNKVLVEAPIPVNDQSETANDYSPFQAERSWDRQAEDNVTERLERQGLLAPRGEVDKVLEAVVNNLEVTNNLDITPEVRCRDELGHVVLGHRMDSQFAFFNRVRFDEKETFRHFDFARTPEEEQAAKVKGTELLSNSPYKQQSGNAQLFLQALKNRAREIPNLISPHLGDRLTTSWTIVAAVFSEQSSDAEAKPAGNVIAALPLGGRIKVDPWDDQLRMLKSKPVGTVAESEKVPFEVTPFIIYLTRQGEHATTEAPGAMSAQTDSEAKP